MNYKKKLVAINNSMINWLQEFALANDLSVSSVIRMAINEFKKKENKKNKKVFRKIVLRKVK